MSRLLGPARQNGYVVPDLEQAIEGWLRVGVGPWIVHPHITLDRFEHRGRASSPDISIALAYAGELQIELIQPHDDAPSLYREFLDRCPLGGLQHLGFWVDDYAAQRDAGLERGWVIGHEGSIWGTPFTYFDTEHHLGTVMEIVDLSEKGRAGFERLEALCNGWDGTDRPVRVIGR